MGAAQEDAPQESDLASYKVIAFRGGLLPEQYKGVVYSKWLRSLRYGNDYFKLIDAPAYYEAYHRYISNILKHAVVRLAVLSDDADVVLGFSVTRGTILDYVHVLRIRLKVPTGISVVDYRGRGIGKSLVPDNIEAFTHITKMGLIIWGNKYSHWKFNPFA